MLLDVAIFAQWKRKIVFILSDEPCTQARVSHCLLYEHHDHCTDCCVALVLCTLIYSSLLQMQSDTRLPATPSRQSHRVRATRPLAKAQAHAPDMVGAPDAKGATRHAAATPKAQGQGQEQLAAGTSTGDNVDSWGDTGKRFLDAVKGGGTEGKG